MYCGTLVFFLFRALGFEDDRVKNEITDNSRGLCCLDKFISIPRNANRIPSWILLYVNSFEIKPWCGTAVVGFAYNLWTQAKNNLRSTAILFIFMFRLYCDVYIIQVFPSCAVFVYCMKFNSDEREIIKMYSISWFSCCANRPSKWRIPNIL